MGENQNSVLVGRILPGVEWMIRGPVKIRQQQAHAERPVLSKEPIIQIMGTG